MQLHPIQQPGQSHIITPTASILNAYNEYLRISNSQQWSFLCSRKCYKQQSSIYLDII